MPMGRRYKSALGQNTFFHRSGMNTGKSRYMFSSLVLKICVPQGICPHSIRGSNLFCAFPSWALIYCFFWWPSSLLCVGFLFVFVGLFRYFLFVYFCLMRQVFSHVEWNWKDAVVSWSAVLKRGRKTSQMPKACLHIQIIHYPDYKVKSRIKTTYFLNLQVP